MWSPAHRAPSGASFQNHTLCCVLATESHTCSHTKPTEDIWCDHKFVAFLPACGDVTGDISMKHRDQVPMTVEAGSDADASLWQWKGRGCLLGLQPTSVWQKPPAWLLLSQHHLFAALFSVCLCRAENVACELWAGLRFPSCSQRLGAVPSVPAHWGAGSAEGPGRCWSQGTKGEKASLAPAVLCPRELSPALWGEGQGMWLPPDPAQLPPTLDPHVAGTEVTCDLLFQL